MAFNPTFLTILLIFTIAGLLVQEYEMKKVKKSNDELKKEILKTQKNIEEIKKIIQDEK